MIDVSGNSSNNINSNSRWMLKNWTWNVMDSWMTIRNVSMSVNLIFFYLSSSANVQLHIHALWWCEWMNMKNWSSDHDMRMQCNMRKWLYLLFVFSSLFLTDKGLNIKISFYSRRWHNVNADVYGTQLKVIHKRLFQVRYK